VVGQVGF